MPIQLPLALLLQESPPTSPGPSQESPSMIVPFLLILVVFYFLLIRPESKRRKEHERMLGNLGKGDTVLSNGGIIGTVVAVKENLITVQVADGVRIKLVRSAIQGLVDPQTGLAPQRAGDGRGAAGTSKADSGKHKEGARS